MTITPSLQTRGIGILKESELQTHDHCPLVANEGDRSYKLHSLLHPRCKQGGVSGNSDKNLIQCPPKTISLQIRTPYIF